MVIDRAQATDADPGAELVQHAHIGRAVAMGEVGKAPPSPLFGQEPDQSIETVSRRQVDQQMRAPQLRGTESPMSSGALPGR
jgi:hypothetical protein